MSKNDYRSLLGFTDVWFALDVITEETLSHYAETFESSRDKNTEHYRYGAFQRFLSENRPLSASTAEGLYELGVSDPDRGMGEAIMADILRLSECPDSVSARGIASGRKAFVRIVHGRRLLLDLQHGPLTADLFQECLKSRDSTVLRMLLARDDLSTEQLLMLSESRVGRAVRNMAIQKLRSQQSESRRDESTS